MKPPLEMRPAGPLLKKTTSKKYIFMGNRFKQLPSEINFHEQLAYLDAVGLKNHYENLVFPCQFV